MSIQHGYEVNDAEMMEREAILAELAAEETRDADAFDHVVMPDRDDEGELEGVAWCLNPSCDNRTNEADSLCLSC